MNPAARSQLRNIDRALLSLCDERARLLSEVEAGDPGRASAVEDLLRRHEGPTSAEAVREIFAAIDRHCARFACETGPIGRLP